MSTQKEISQLQNLDLSGIRKKRFSIDGDTNRILELNTSDLNILPRLRESYPRLKQLADDAMKRWPESMDDSDDITSEATNTVIDILVDIDKEMREIIDYIFDAPVSEMCVPSGSMYDPINGQFRYEYIMETLSKLYETELSGEMSRISSRVQKHTNKYVKK